MLQADGVEMVIVRPPSRDSYIDARDKRVPESEHWFESQIEAIRADLHVGVWLPLRASDLAWLQDYFLDYGLLTIDGSIVFSIELGGTSSAPPPEF